MEAGGGRRRLLVDVGGGGGEGEQRGGREPAGGEDGGEVRQVDRTAGPVCTDFQQGGREHQGKDDCRMLEFLKLEFKIHPM